jgi:hypothetical protein
MVDGTSITDAALARKLESAVKRDATVKVRIGYEPKQTARLDAIRALVKKAGVTNVEVSSAIVTAVPDSPPPARDETPTVILTIDSTGRLFLGARVIAVGELDKELAELAKRTKKLALQPDKSTPAGVIQDLMARCKAAGLTEVSFLSN